MKKLIGILLVLVIIVAFVPTRKVPVQNSSVSQVDMITQAMQSIVRVTHPDYGDYAASGFYIGNGVIVTAGHVSEMEGLEEVIFEDGSKYQVLEQIVHPDYDCGFLLIDDPNKSALKFDTVEVQRGEEIYILGNPDRMSFLLTKGVVCGRTTRDGYFGDVLLIVTDATAYSGNSGSPVLDGDGEIRGLHIGWCVQRGLYGVNICVGDILNALEHAGLEIE